MRNVYHRLLLIIATATHSELARHVKYLKVENQILRKRLPKVVLCTPQKRRLARFGAKLGGAIKELCTIVHPHTLYHWIQDDRKAAQKKQKRKARRTKPQIRRLILTLAKETGWGYTRILGELRKLEITSVSRNTVKAIMRAHGYDPGPKRGVGTWDEFLKIHAASLWQCDFFSVRSLTPKGFRDLYLLVFLHVSTRRVYLSPVTQHPDAAWVEEQAKAFVDYARGSKHKTDLVMHDNDTKFTPAFDQLLKEAKLRVRKTAIRSPNTAAYVERFIQTVRQECLDYFVVFGERHLNHLLKVFVGYYHTKRPHQGLDNELLSVKKSRRKKPPPDDVPLLSEVRCESQLGGLLRHYYRRAA